MKIWREKETLAIEPKTEWSNASGNSELDVLIAAKTRRQDQTWPAFCFPDFLVLQFRVAEIPSNFILHSNSSEQQHPSTLHSSLQTLAGSFRYPHTE
jgi:hypothetical protein